MPASADQALPVVRVGEIKCEESTQRWLVEGLWGARSVGVIGGAPKCAKTWLGLDMALSVATGTACLGKYAVPESGPVLVYLAEDALLVVRERIEGIPARRDRGLDVANVAIHVITVPVLRLDGDPDRARLWETTRGLRPKLLLLDPLVRLHGIDENNAGEVAQLLAYFRWLQRQLDLSVLLVHHTRKSAAGGVAAGQGLRGSSDIHAFGDSNLYLRRSREHLILSSEHRAAPAAASVSLELVVANPQTIHLEVIGELRDGSAKLAIDGKQRSLEERVLDLLGQGATVTRAKLRDSLGVKNERLGEALEVLERTGRLRRTPAGWQRRNGSIEGGRSRSL
jgi:AAA domain-containing protein